MKDCLDFLLRESLTLKIMQRPCFLEMCKNYIPDPKVSPFSPVKTDRQFGPFELRHIMNINQNVYASLQITQHEAT